MGATAGTHLYLYDIRSVQKGENKPFNTWSVGSNESNEIIQFRWHPTDPNLLAVVTKDTKSYIVDIQKLESPQKVQGENFSSLCWSPNGKKIGFGMTDGTVSVRDYPFNGKVQQIDKPDLELKETLYVSWVAEDTIFAGYKEDDRAMPLFIYTLTADGKVKDTKRYVSFQDSEIEVGNFFFAYVPEWSIIVVASTNCTEYDFIYFLMIDFL